MKINDIDLYNLPLWLNGVAEKLEEGCQEELKKESDLYNQVLEESGEILDKYRFISTIIDGDVIRKPMNLAVSELEALSRFWRLETKQRDMENLQTYLLGGRNMLELLQLLKII